MPEESTEITRRPDILPSKRTEKSSYWRFVDGKWRLTREGAEKTLPTAHEIGHTQMDADGKLIVYHSENTRWGKQSPGIFERGAAHRAKNEYNIRLADYELLRDRVLKCGYGALIFAEYLNSISNEQGHKLLKRMTGENMGTITDGVVQYVKDYLPACTMNRYVNVGGQTVYVGDAEKAGVPGAMTVDDLMNNWLEREKDSNYSEAIRKRGRTIIEKTLAAFEYGSSTDQEWEKANQERISSYKKQALVKRRIRSGRYAGVTPSLVIRVHEIESAGRLPPLQNPWKT